MINIFNEQKEIKGDAVVGEIIKEYLQDPVRDVKQPHLTISEFVDYLYSKQVSLGYKTEIIDISAGNYYNWL